MAYTMREPGNLSPDDVTVNGQRRVCREEEVVEEAQVVHR
jgi:hypothetical protein